MNEDKLDTLLDQCESPIERELLTQLYPHLPTAHTRELCAQYKIDKYHDMPVTIPDFAFPDMQIAIYCDGFATAKDNRKKFAKDRFQLRELQLRGWIVLRFAGREINFDSEMIVDTIQRAIARRDRQRAWRSRQQPRIPTAVKSPAPQTGQGDQKARKPVAQQKHQKPLVLHSGPARQWKHQTQQKPEGGLCGVIFLAGVVIGAVVLLNLIF